MEKQMLINKYFPLQTSDDVFKIPDARESFEQDFDKCIEGYEAEIERQKRIIKELVDRISETQHQDNIEQFDPRKSFNRPQVHKLKLLLS